MSTTVSVAAVIIRDDKILIGRRMKKDGGRGQYVFPGGRLEEDESFEAALVRECEEEVGLKVEMGKIITATRSAHSGKANVGLVYRARTLDPSAEPRPSAEIADPKFVTIWAAELLDLMPVTREVLEFLASDLKPLTLELSVFQIRVDGETCRHWVTARSRGDAIALFQAKTRVARDRLVVTGAPKSDLDRPYYIEGTEDGPSMPMRMFAQLKGRGYCIALED